MALLLSAYMPILKSRQHRPMQLTNEPPIVTKHRETDIASDTPPFYLTHHLSV